MDDQLQQQVHATLDALLHAAFPPDSDLAGIMIEALRADGIVFMRVALTHEGSIEANMIASSPFKLDDEDDRTLARIDTVGDLSHNLGTFAGEKPYTPPKDKRVQQLLKDAARNREAEARLDQGEAAPTKIYSDPRLDPKWKAPKGFHDPK